MAVNNNSYNAFISSEVSIPRPVRFWVLLSFDLPSIICSLLLICHILINRNQRRALHNHTILAILIFALPIQLIDISFYLAFFQYGSVQPSQPIICQLWWLLDIGFYSGVLILLCWLSIERHILIFHDRWMANRRGRFLFHYLPILIIIAYVLLFYTIGIFVVPCENIYDYSVPLCGALPCYQAYYIPGVWDLVGNGNVPIILEGFASVGIIIRVQWKKQRLRQSAQWHKHRRMIIQLLLVSSLDICLNMPLYSIPLARLCGLPADYGVQVDLYFFFLGYFVIFLFPFASLAQFPELRKKIKNKILNLTPRPPERTFTVAPTGPTQQRNRPL